MNPSAPPETFSPASPSCLTSHLELRLLAYAAPMARRCWRHSLHKNSRPWVVLKGTVVFFPHCELFVFVSLLAAAWCPLTVGLVISYVIPLVGSLVKPVTT